MPASKIINTQCLYFTQRLARDMVAITEYPLTVVEAPMGYGKTTAVREGLLHSGIAPLWIHVFANDAENFWDNFTSLIGELDKGCGESLMQLGLPRDAVSLSEAMNLLSGMDLKSSTVIVVDDYHNIDSAELNSFFELLSEYGLPDLHIVLTARYSKLKRLEELKLKRSLYHITTECFELHPSDIRDYFRLCGVTLSSEQAENLHRMTDGWISALYLFLIEYAAQGSFTRSDSIYRLLEKAVYEPLPEETKRLLLSVCSFDGFTGEQAEAVWGGDRAEPIFSELTASNLFVLYDSKLKMYYIHSIFTDFLREEFDRKSGAYKAEIYGKAAVWNRQTGNYSEARKYCFLAGDFEQLLIALEEDDAIDYSPCDKELLKKYMAACPEEVKARHPFALMKFAVPLFVHNEMALAGQIYASIAESIKNSEMLDTEARNRLHGMLELHLCFSSFNDIEKMAGHQKNAWALLGRPAEIFSRKIHWTFGSPSVLYLYHRESGKLKEHTDELIGNLPLYSRLMNGHGAGGGYIMEAERFFHAGDFDNAEISLQKAELEAKAADESNILLCCEFLKARLFFMRGDHASLFATLIKMRETMADRKLYNYLHTVEICEGFIYAWLKQTERLPSALLDANPATLHLGFPAQGIFHILAGRAMLLRGDYLKLIGSGEYMTQIASVFPNTLGIIYTNILLAAANHMVSREEAAFSCLRKALDLALPDQLFLPFVENCDYIEPLLRELSVELPYWNGIVKILGLYEVFQSGKAQILLGMNPVKSSLSDRELEIARLAAEGLSNKMIGQQLYISENTVKSTLKSVYSKLMVNHRLSLKDVLDSADK